MFTLSPASAISGRGRKRKRRVRGRAAELKRSPSVQQAVIGVVVLLLALVMVGAVGFVLALVVVGAVGAGVGAVGADVGVGRRQSQKIVSPARRMKRSFNRKV